MARLITCLTLLFAFITLVSAQSVETINTPAGPIQEGANITITWSLLPGATPQQPGTLQVVDKDTQDTETISDQLDLNAEALDWTVDVDPGTYHLTLIDEAGAKFSGPFDVVAKSPAKTPTGPSPPAAALVGDTTPSVTPVTPSNQPNSVNFASTISAYSPLLGLTSVAVLMIHFA